MMNRIRMQCPHRACILHTLRGTTEHRRQMFQEATVQMKIGRIAHTASRNWILGVWAGHVTIGCAKDGSPMLEQALVELIAGHPLRQFQPVIESTISSVYTKPISSKALPYRSRCQL